MTERDSTRYRINTPQIVHEAIDNEVVIVDFETGNYYSLEDVGAVVWTTLAAGADSAAIVQQIDAHYDCADADLASITSEFLGELVEQGLIVPMAASDDSISLPKLNGASAVKSPFSAPKLNRYTDMQDLLLLDPIHDVDETGWPNLPVLESVEE